MVVLSTQKYKSITEATEELITTHDEHTTFQLLKTQFPEYHENTIGSIFNQYLRKKTKQNIRHVRDNIKTAVMFYCNYSEQNRHGVFLDLAKKYRVSPISIARLVIDYLGVEEKLTASDMIKDTTKIKNSYLSYEIRLACLRDLSCSPYASNIAGLIGRDYEILLEERLKELGLTYKTEEDLRNLKYPKTPDIVLDVPIVVDDQVVKWIESKALFADTYCHASYIQAQYSHYSNFGPGLVIYWFGHLDTVKDEKGQFLVYARFPSAVTKLEKYEFNTPE